MRNFLVQDNLYDSSKDSPVPEEIQTTTNSNADAFSLNFDPFAGTFNESAFRDFIVGLNSFTLAWCIFYSLLFIGDFLFYSVRYSKGKISRENAGVESLKRAFNIWLSYLFCWLALMVYNLLPFTGLLVILVYLIKLLHTDLPNILSIVHDLAGLNGLNSSFKKITTPLIKLLRFDFKK